jgi:hypothetical protein
MWSTFRQSCVRSPKKSISHRSLELGIQNIIHKHLRLYAYKIQLKREITPDDWPKRYDFASLRLNKIDDDAFLHEIWFTDEATFHMNGCVNQHNCQIWGSEQPNEIHKYDRGSMKVSQKLQIFLSNLTLESCKYVLQFLSDCSS